LVCLHIFIYRQQREEEQKKAIEAIAYEAVTYGPEEAEYFAQTATKVTNYLFLSEFTYVRLLFSSFRSTFASLIVFLFL